MRLAALLLVFGMSVASASSLATGTTVSVQVQVEGLPGLTFSRQVPAVVTLVTPWGSQTASLNSGALYRADPQHYWASLNPLRLRVKVPAGTAAGRYPVRVSTTLYVCDQNIHLCTIRPSETQGQLDLKGFGRSAPLILTLRVPKLSGF